MTDKHILITGGCGFVGRYFCHKFSSLGYTVTCVDNLVSSSSLHPDNWSAELHCDNLAFINQDCRDFFKIHMFQDQNSISSFI